MPRWKASRRRRLVIRGRSVRRVRARSSRKKFMTRSSRRWSTAPRKSLSARAKIRKITWVRSRARLRSKRCSDYIDVGKKEGRVLVGGDRAPGDGYFVQATVIADVDPKARIAQEEIFGPVLAVIKARDFDHALEIANGTRIRPDRRRLLEESAEARKSARKFLRWQSVSESQVHRRNGRRASVRRIQYVGNGFKNRRPGLSVAVPARQEHRGKDPVKRSAVSKMNPPGDSARAGFSFYAARLFRDDANFIAR